MDFDLRHLEIFCKVLEYRSFSKAALAVFLSQASVSERIATLEDLVGARLFDRMLFPLRQASSYTDMHVCC